MVYFLLDKAYPVTMARRNCQRSLPELLTQLLKSVKDKPENNRKICSRFFCYIPNPRYSIRGITKFFSQTPDTV